MDHKPSFNLGSADLFGGTACLLFIIVKPSRLLRSRNRHLLVLAVRVHQLWEKYFHHTFI